MLYQNNSLINSLWHQGEEICALYQGNKLIYGWEQAEGKTVTTKQNGAYPIKQMIVYGASYKQNGEIISVGSNNTAMYRGRVVYIIKITITSQNKTTKTIAIQLDEPLRGVKTTDESRATYVDENGDMWVCDTIDDFGRLIQRVDTQLNVMPTPIKKRVTVPKFQDFRLQQGNTIVTNDAQAYMQIGYFVDEKYNVWKELSNNIQNGVFPAIGEQLTTHHEKYGDIIWDVIDYDYLTPSDKKHSVLLMAHNIISVMPFDSQEAIYYAENGLTAGQYNITLGGDFEVQRGGGKTYTFTLTKDIPKGGQLVLNWFSSDNSPTSITSYGSSVETNAIETSYLTQGNSGVSLGVSAILKEECSENCNCISRASFYGADNYQSSEVRQWLNSSTTSAELWTPQTKYDRPMPLWQQSDGFMLGFDKDFLSLVQTVTIECNNNNVFENTLESTGLYTTYDKFFLPSYTEVGFDVAPTIGEKAVYFLSNRSSSVRIKDPVDFCQIWWLRNAQIGQAGINRVVSETGRLATNISAGDAGVVPMCVIA